MRALLILGLVLVGQQVFADDLLLTPEPFLDRSSLQPYVDQGICTSKEAETMTQTSLDQFVANRERLVKIINRNKEKAAKKQQARAKHLDEAYKAGQALRCVTNAAGRAAAGFGSYHNPQESITTVGNTDYLNGPVTGTMTHVGNFGYYTGSDGSHFSTSRVGNTTYVNP
jgi:hypothetical protein